MMLGMRLGGRVLPVLLLLLAGLALRVVFVHFHPPLAGDSLIYGDLAQNILDHHTYGLTEDGKVRPTLIRLPGYPGYLALCFVLFGRTNYMAAVWVQVVISLAECGLLGVLAGKLLGRRAGIAAVGLALLCPFTANYSATPLTETLGLFCTTLAFLSLARWTDATRRSKPWNAWLGAIVVSLSFAVLLRPDRGLLAAVVIPAMLWVALREEGRKAFGRVGPVLAVAASFVLPLILWGARNWRVFHVVQPLAPKYANDPGEEVAFGFQRWYRTWAIDYKSTVEVYWPYDGSVVNVKNIPDRAFHDEAQQTKVEQLLGRYNEETSSTPDIDAAFERVARERITSNPLHYYVVMPAARLADMWFHPRTELLRMPLDWWNWRAHKGKSLFSAAYAILNVAYLVLAAMGLRRWSREDWSGHGAVGYAMLAFVVLRCALLATLDNSEQRYTMECYPVILLLASFALSRRDMTSVKSSPHLC